MVVQVSFIRQANLMGRDHLLSVPDCCRLPQTAFAL